MSEWVVSRWHRFGNDRLYAETVDGAPLGYVDLKTNQLYPAQPSDLPLLAAAVADYLRAEEDNTGRHNRADDEPAPTPPPGIYRPRHEVVDWEDLSLKPPGAAARERAVDERTAAPVRTRLARLLHVHTDERAWRIGADGEQAVATQLARLGAEWRTLHAVPVGENGADIDHVVIGPPGVFTVNSKNHPDANVWVGGDAFLVNGARTQYVRNSRHEATRAERLLTARAGYPISVTGMIAITGAHRGLTVKEQPRDGKVVIVGRKEIVGHLLGQPQVLGPYQVDAIFDLARRSTTWQPVTA